jgi:hypothetical protein
MSTIEPIPAKLSAMATPLGVPTSFHKAEGLGCFLFAVANCVITFGLFCVWVGYMVISDDKTPAKDKWMGWVSIGAMGLPVMIAGSWMRRRFNALGSMRLWLMPGGLAWDYSQGRGVARWDEITKIYAQLTQVYQNGRLIRESRRYTVRTAGGSEFMFSEFVPEVEQVVETLEREVGRVLFPQMLARFQAGEAVAFDKLTVSKAGLRHGSNTLPWSEVERISVEQGYLAVQKTGKFFKWGNIKAADIPNFHLAQALIETALKNS